MIVITDFLLMMNTTMHMVSSKTTIRITTIVETATLSSSKIYKNTNLQEKTVVFLENNLLY